MPARSTANNLTDANVLDVCVARRNDGWSWRQIADHIAALGLGRFPHSTVRYNTLRYIANTTGAVPTTWTRVQRSLTDTLTFGIEIEFRRPYSGGVMDPQTIADALTAAGVNTVVEGYNHRTRRHWKLIHDASSDRELVSPVLSGEDGLTQVRTAMRVLRSLGMHVTTSEGMHVHVGMARRTPEQVLAIAETYVANSNLFDSVVARSRRPGAYNYSEWTTHMNAAELRSVRSLIAAGRSDWHESWTRSNPGHRRYRSTNFIAYGTHGTMEFRQHQGSLNGTKAVAWIRLLLGLVAHVDANGGGSVFASVDEMTNTLNINRTSAAFLRSRVAA